MLRQAGRGRPARSWRSTLQLAGGTLSSPSAGRVCWPAYFVRGSVWDLGRKGRHGLRRVAFGESGELARLLRECEKILRRAGRGRRDVGA